MILLNGIEINPTIFPDKTSQVWKLPNEAFGASPDIITWSFENEAELFHVCQLADLVKNASLEMPYLPYGRQDKAVNNEETFALRTFARIINSCGFRDVRFLDGHSAEASKLIRNSCDEFPSEAIEAAQRAVPGCLLAYPDKGAFDRYSPAYGNEAVLGDKVRDQSTGYISHFEISQADPRERDVLIIDDICDGGMTFKILAKSLLDAGAESVHLYVTHGIFSKGLDTLRESGISRIFTHEGEIK